ncbi:MAG: hypothetical protein HOK21_02370 [Rhodospirillaceae bacterium]|jgi:hypothetical protein|nr:hypothetical protein [Rhodospirillaceae bacterium]MBT4691366.1 hypothetical protein [Rhodospirillaceae bacterium]MBT5081422.1 hypothetical protein [Rhodospirillaceae bacterium]MBT5522906.1 hypothetical protein [Rhodospirillaceae bacterium]MBT5880859.1 hypothetical protein [Rhodospirillaceae bacterium]
MTPSVSQATPTATPQATPGAKMIYLIKRRAHASREELIVHWFANHMPAVIARNEQGGATASLTASRYLGILFDPQHDKPHPWDGMAQLWFDQAPPPSTSAHGEVPADSFQERAAPYWPWATREYVIMDGALPLNPLTLNPPFPCTRSGFFKVTFLVALKAGKDSGEFFDCWLNEHVPNVRNTMEAVGGFRYVVSHSLDPSSETYAGMAELYFPDPSGWDRYRDHIEPDGMKNFVDYDNTDVFYTGTEMVGIEAP